ncbi:MAG: hypothetical protein IMW89_14400 [Ktedonobacteraceae bacterium]|nr:hypothetical protein [Ktedonobacteraceae bacterium]
MDELHSPEENNSPGTRSENTPTDLPHEISSLGTQPLSTPPDVESLDARPLSVSPASQRAGPFSSRRGRIQLILLSGVGLLIVLMGIAVVASLSGYPALVSLLSAPSPTPRATARPPTPTPTPTPTFDPAQGAVLPTHRIVAFYGVPGAEPTGPAYVINDAMFSRLKQQGAAYEQLDPAHPVQLGIDLVVSVPDSFPGPEHNYSHHVDAATIQSYIDFCQQHDLLLFLDLNFGQAPVMQEVNFFLPYLQKYSFVHMAIDPEWMFPRHDGIPGVNLSNVRASDLNPIIRAVAEIPMQYHVPRKILIIHQYRPTGDTLKNPYDPAQAEIADKRNLLFDPRVDVVVHVDSVGGYAGDIEDKKQQYSQWVQQDMEAYGNFLYGGFKLFYKLEARTRLMTPAEVLKLDPPPMVVTYGN